MDFQEAWEVKVSIRKSSGEFKFDETIRWFADECEALGFVQDILERIDDPMHYSRRIYPKNNWIELSDVTKEKQVAAIEWKKCRILVDNSKSS